MKRILATMAVLLLSAGGLHAEPTKLTVYNYSDIDAFVLVMRGKQPTWFPVPKAPGKNVVTTTMAKDKSDRVFLVYQTDKTGTDISNPAAVAGLGSIKVTAIPGDELAVVLQPAGSDKVEILFWSYGGGEYRVIAGPGVPSTYDPKPLAARLKKDAPTAKALETVGP